jgi:3-deoxy-D-manno-octulosonate 8-phosphate phosphatase (KDO 8-P phosphatase)
MSQINAEDFFVHLTQVKLLALDVDGVLTDGGLYYTESGEEIKKFNIKDGQGLVSLMQTGINVAIITSNSSLATVHRAKKLGIEHVFIGVTDKLEILQNLCEKLTITLSQVAYMGDDIGDLTVLSAVGCPITVADAIPEAQQRSLYVTKLSGGMGAVREVCNLLCKSQNSSNK